MSVNIGPLIASLGLEEQLSAGLERLAAELEQETRRTVFHVLLQSKGVVRDAVQGGLQWPCCRYTPTTEWTVLCKEAACRPW